MKKPAYLAGFFSAFLPLSCGSGGVASIRRSASSRMRAASSSLRSSPRFGSDMSNPPNNSNKSMLGRDETIMAAPAIACALGELTVRWTAIEYELTLLFKYLAGCSYETAGVVMYGVNATSARLDIVRLMAERHGNKPDAALALEAVAQVRRLCSRRNALVHHRWFHDVLSGNCYTFDYRSSPGTESRRKKQSVRAILALCNECTDALRPLRRAYGSDISDEQLIATKISETQLRARMSAK